MNFPQCNQPMRILCRHWVCGEHDSPVFVPAAIRPVGESRGEWLAKVIEQYAMLTPSLPRERIGVMMGMFNFFIVLPQIVAAGLLGGILKYFLHSEPMNVLVLGGASMGLAALLTLVQSSVGQRPRQHVVAAPVHDHHQAHPAS